MNKETRKLTFPKRANNISTLPQTNERRLSTISQAISEVPSEIIIKSRIKYGNKWSTCLGLLAEYSKKSSISGINYIFEVHRPFYEKLFWIIVIVISFYLAIILMLNTYLKWLDSPVVLVFGETLVPIHKIPFPTVTICPEIKMDTKEFDFSNVSQQIWREIRKSNRFENFANLTQEELKRFAATLQICESEVIQRFAPYISKNIHVDVVDSLLNMAVLLNITIPYVKWNDRFYFGDKTFKYVLTDEGVCYQFNGLKASDIYRDVGYMSYVDDTEIDFNDIDRGITLKLNEIIGLWSLDEGYVGQGSNAYPQRSVLSRARNGLFVVLMGMERHFDYSCRTFKQGYKVFLNSPESVAPTTENYILVPHDHEVIVSLMPEYVISTDNLHDISPEKRQCYFNDERYLRFFKSYSQVNCQTECLANFTINKCGCAKFWMPKPLNVPICTLSDVDCYSQATDEMNFIIANQTQQKMSKTNVKIMCDCLPSCNSLRYDFEISRAYYDYKKTIMAHRTTFGDDDTHASRLSVYYKDSQFTAIKRTVIYDLTTLISNCGGIFGLFMGISGFSIIEFIYFFSVRLFNNLRKRRYIKKQLMAQDLAY